ncbi:MAG: tetratricopeptide repeat protein [Candidatus Aegiribacteria sp.]
MKLPGILPLLLVAAAICLRVMVFFTVDGLLPQEGLYVDESTYSMSPFVPGVEGFSRPPGMFVAAMLLNVRENVLISRAILSVLSLLPALALYLALGRNHRFAGFCAAGLALSPFMVLYGFQILPAVPAAALLSFSLLFAVRQRYGPAGFLAGTAMLFRAEFVIIPVVLLALSFRHHLRRWAVFTSLAAVAVLPVVLINLLAGAGPVIAANGGGNLWMGSRWELLATPPGVEYEELMSTGGSPQSGDRVFLERALEEIRSRPVEWLGMGAVKALSFFALPGHGRNVETGWLMRKTLLVLLLPLTLGAVSLGLSAAFRGRNGYWKLIAVSVIVSGVITSFLFFPSARYRTSVLPAFWFLAASAVPNGRILLRSMVPAVAIVLISLLLTYPGKVRSGLTSMLAAQHLLQSGDPASSMEYLRDASRRGYHGADLHNVRGALLSMSGFRREGMEEFQMALRLAPDSPTLWKNYAVSLWSAGRYRESVNAAERAALLNPLLREELGPILESGGNP